MRDHVYLSPGGVWRDQKLDIAILEEPEDTAPELPLGASSIRTRRFALEQSLSSSCLSALVQIPSLALLPHFVGILADAPRTRPKSPGGFLGLEARENEHGFNAELFEYAEVVFNARGESKRDPPRGGKEGLFA